MGMRQTGHSRTAPIKLKRHCVHHLNTDPRKAKRFANVMAVWPAKARKFEIQNRASQNAAFLNAPVYV